MTNEFLIMTGFAVLWMVVAVVIAIELKSSYLRYTRILNMSYKYTVELLKALNSVTEQLNEAQEKLEESEARERL